MNNNQEPVTQTEEKIEAPVDSQTDEKKEEKTFTQEEVNAMILKATNKVNDKYKDVDLKAYNDWKESQKTETEIKQEQDEKYAKQDLELNSIKQENKVLKSGVSVEDVDYVLFKVSKMEGDFEDNLEDFLKENPKYLQKQEVKDTPKTTGVPVTKINSNEEDGVLAILKAKHPDAFD